MQCPLVLLHLFLYTRFPEVEDFHGSVSQLPKQVVFRNITVHTVYWFKFVQYSCGNHKAMHSLLYMYLVLSVL
jgi:hypothetical protein